MTSLHKTTNDLNAQRRRAVQLRLAGKTLADVRVEVGLSTPTIVAAVKAFKAGGWPAVDVKPRGRPRRNDSDASPTELARTALLTQFTAETGQLWSTTSVRNWLKAQQQLDVSLQTCASYLQSWNWLPENQQRRFADAPSTAIQHWISGEYADFKADAKRQQVTMLWLGIRTVDAEFNQLFVHTLRGRCLWMSFEKAPSREQYQQFFSNLLKEFPRGIALVVADKSLDAEATAFSNNSSTQVLVSLAPSSVGIASDTSSNKQTLNARSSRNKPNAATVASAASSRESRVKTRPTASAEKQRNTVSANQPNTDQLKQSQSRQSQSQQTQSHQSQPQQTQSQRTQNEATASKPIKSRLIATRSTRITSSAHASNQTQSAMTNNTKDVTGLNMNQSVKRTSGAANDGMDQDAQSTTKSASGSGSSALPSSGTGLTNLQRLEAESIQIIREVIAEAENPVMLYSIGKDSAVMMHLARKAFYPANPPIPLLHVDTTWKFQEMYRFRDDIVKEYGFELLTHTNPEGVEKGVNPFTHGSALHTDIMKTEALKQALDKHGFDIALGGARRDEEKSRAKERVFSFRTSQHRWEPKNQRPELWNLYNTRKQPGESIRAFPLSNWTELDIWQYIHLQNIPVVPLYFAAERPVVERDGSLIMVDDDRMPLHDGEVPMMRKVRFRTLGCYPLTGAVESKAQSLPEIIQETLVAASSERQGRMIDSDTSASMEKKKQQGYF